jgi:hypothetical protein
MTLGEHVLDIRVREKDGRAETASASADNEHRRLNLGHGVPR